MNDPLSSKIEMPAAQDQARTKEQVMAELMRHPFRAPWWLRNRHAQTIWANRVRRVEPVPLQLERWETPDGDFLRLHFQNGRPEQPTVLLLTGLEGSVESKYIAGMNHRLGREGWTVITMEHRSCGGEMNRARRTYHSGTTDDLDFVVRSLIERQPEISLFVVGYSLGANMIAKWLGERGDSVPSNVKAAAVISAPYDLLVTGPYMDSGVRRLYVANFLRTLIPKIIEKEEQFPGCVDVAAVKKSSTFREFDTYATAALHGFKDAEDYYGKVSCGLFLDGIRRPTLLQSAADDPFNPADTLPREQAERSPYLHPLFTEHGGHTAYVAANPSGGLSYWIEDQVYRFFEAYRQLG